MLHLPEKGQFFLGGLFGSDAVSPSNRLLMTCFSTFFYTVPCFLGVEFCCLVFSTVETFMQLHAECHRLDALLFPILSEFALLWFILFFALLLLFM